MPKGKQPLQTRHIYRIKARRVKQYIYIYIYIYILQVESLSKINLTLKSTQGDEDSQNFTLSQKWEVWIED